MKKILMLLGALCLFHCLISCVAPVSTEGGEDTMLYASNFTDYANSKVFSYVKGFASSNLRQNKTEPVSVGNLTDGSTSVQSYVIANTTDATSPDKNPWFAVDLGLVRTINKVRLVPGAGQDAANGDSSTSLGTYPDAYPVKYRVQVCKTDKDVEAKDIPSLEWETVASVTDGVYATRNITFAQTKARHVRILVDEYNGDYCALLELSVFGVRSEVKYSDLGKEINVLFIGNSLTYYNNMWSVFEGISLMRGHHVNASAVTFGGKNLIFHSNAPNTESAIKAKKYDYIVLQDICGSFTDDKLTRGSAAIIEKIKTYNPDAKVVFYATWPKRDAKDRTAEFTGCYLNKAQTYKALIAPAGEGFYELNSDGTDYYESDGTHPQPIGSFLSASTFYYTIFEEEPLISWSDTDVNNLLNLINSYVSDSATTGKRVSYSKDLLSKVNSIAHKYSRAIAPCAKDTSGSTPYLSVAGAYTYPATE